MIGESFPGLKGEWDSIEISPDNLDGVLARLSRLRQEMLEHDRIASTSPLKHVRAESIQRRDIYRCGYESGIAVLDDLMPIEGHSWKDEIESLEQDKS